MFDNLVLFVEYFFIKHKFDFERYGEIKLLNFIMYWYLKIVYIIYIYQ